MDPPNTALPERHRIGPTVAITLCQMCRGRDQPRISVSVTGKNLRFLAHRPDGDRGGYGRGAVSGPQQPVGAKPLRPWLARSWKMCLRCPALPDLAHDRNAHAHIVPKRADHHRCPSLLTGGNRLGGPADNRAAAKARLHCGGQARFSNPDGMRGHR